MHQETIFKLIVANENVAALFPKILSFNSIYCQNKDVIPLAIFDEKIAVTNFILHNPKSRMSLAEQLVVNKIKEIFASLI